MNLKHHDSIFDTKDGKDQEKKKTRELEINWI